MDDLHAEVGDVAAEWRTAMLDGSIDAEERKSLSEKLADVEMALASLRHELAREEG